MIYVHVPFCRSFCTYCDFYSEVTHKVAGRFDAYIKALDAEIFARAGEITSDCNTLYVGGGTPSVLPPSFFSGLVATLKKAGVNTAFDEFTVEVNPEDIVEKGQGYVEALLEAGVNRISMGIQSLDDSILKWMNRPHTSREAVEACYILRRAGVKNLSVDLIFGISHLGMDVWKDTVERVLELGVEHISCYQLSIEPGSMLCTLVGKGRYKEADEELCREQYELLCSMLSAEGFRHYEISNFAKEGYCSRHNSAYWKYVPYTGFGPGAHSFSFDGKTASRSWNKADLKAYIAAFSGEGKENIVSRELLTSEQMRMERIMLGLRTAEGVQRYLLPEGDLPLVDLGNGYWRIPESDFFISDSIISSLI